MEALHATSSRGAESSSRPALATPNAVVSYSGEGWCWGVVSLVKSWFALGPVSTSVRAFSPPRLELEAGAGAPSVLSTLEEPRV
jgi:hypothetical protein